MTRTFSITAIVFSLSSSLVAQHAGRQCEAGGSLVRIAQLPEASGIAASRRVPGRLWAHKDSGEPILFALDTRGAVTGQITVPGAKVEDWEAVTVGTCAGGSCVYVGDIGDNDAHREQITIYRFPEPGNRLEAPASGDVFHAAYPDGPQDAEAMLVAPDGRLFIVTKGRSSPVTLYALPADIRPGSTVKLERIGQPRAANKSDDRERITDGAISPDGRWVVLRTTASLHFYRAAELLSGKWNEASNVDLRPLGEPQGEGVTFGSDGVLYLLGEGGGGGQAGTFARLTCKGA